MRSFGRLCALKERVQQLVPLFYLDEPTFNIQEHTVFFLSVSGDVCYRVTKLIPYSNSSFILISLQKRRFDLLFDVFRSSSPNSFRVVFFLESLECNPS